MTHEGVFNFLTKKSLSLNSIVFIELHRGALYTRRYVDYLVQEGHLEKRQLRQKR